MTQPDFGQDTSCTTELRPGTRVSGARLVGEAAYRRLTTVRGTLRGGEDEANYGDDLSNLIGTVQSDNDAAAVPARVKNELQKDDRIDVQNTTIEATVVRDAGAIVSIGIVIDAQTSAGPFTLTLSVSAVGVELVGLTP